MSKKKPHNRKWIGKIKEPEIWISEDDIKGEFDFLQKLHPGREMEEAIQSLVEHGFISIRMGKNGKREYRFNRESVNAALAKLPPEVRNNPREIKIYEDTAIICDYDNELTTLLSVITQQTDELIEDKSVIPWIVKTREQLEHDTMGTVKNLQLAFTRLEAKNFIEITQSGPEQYRYRLNVPVVQAAMNALPNRFSEGEVEDE